MARDHENVTPVMHYIREQFAPEDDVLKKISARLIEQGNAIHIGPEEGKILQLLIKMHGVRRVVEVGTLGAYSTLWMARALPEEGHIYTIERDAARCAMAQEHIIESEVKDKVSILHGDAAHVLESLTAKAPFDMIFIDADKPSYPRYLDWAEQHIRCGGLIVGDNTLLFDTVAEAVAPQGVAPTTWAAMRSFNARLSDPSQYFSAMLPTKEGMTIAIKLF